MEDELLSSTGSLLAETWEVNPSGLGSWWKVEAHGTLSLRLHENPQGASQRVELLHTSCLKNLELAIFHGWTTLL